MRTARVLAALALAALATAPAVAWTDVLPGLPGSGPHVAVVNPLDPDNVVAVRGGQLSVSTDFGLSFAPAVAAALPASLSGYAPGDRSVVAFDAGGRLFWAYEAFDDVASDGACGPGDDMTLVVQRVDPLTGGLLGPAVDATPGDACDGDPWLAADANPASVLADRLYLTWTRGDGEEILFARSADQGVTWAGGPALSLPEEGYVGPATAAVAPNGELFVAYHSSPGGQCSDPAGNVVVVRDADGGSDLIALTPVTRTTVPASVSCNFQEDAASAVPQTDFSMAGSLRPYLLSHPLDPAVFLLVASDDQDGFGSGDPGDVLLWRSVDSGLTWPLTPTVVGGAPANTLQAFPSAAIDQAGNVAVTWYDTRAKATNPAGNLLLDVYASVSRDGGRSFTNDFRVSDAPFDPDLMAPSVPGHPGTTSIGGHNGLAAANGVAYAAWTGNRAAGQSVVTDVFSILSAFPDGKEPNDSRHPGVATNLGPMASYNEAGLTLHTVLDEDFFRVVAVDTGILTVSTTSNPRFGDVDFQALDRFGSVAAQSAPFLDLSPTETRSIPVVSGQEYLVRVFAQPGQHPPMNTYSLDIVNTPAPAPFAVDLAPASDSGLSDTDDLTNVAKPVLRVRLDEPVFTSRGVAPSIGPFDPGFKVVLEDNGFVLGMAERVPAMPGLYELALAATPASLAEGGNSLTARTLVIDPAGVTGTTTQSPALMVTLDTVAPGAPPSPDLVASSDSGGVSDDDVTALATLQFTGFGEGNRRVHLYASDGIADSFVARDLAEANGLYEILMSPARDGVWFVTARQEDGAGNLGPPSAPLPVTVAREALRLPNAMIGAASGPATVDLAAGTVAGFPGVPGASGAVGIAGIPRVELDAGGQALAVLGTALDDDLAFAPTGAASGTLTRAGSAQALALAGVSALTVDPRLGTDALTVKGTSGRDAVKAVSDTVARVQVNALLPVSAPAASTELLGISTGFGGDSVEVAAYDRASALWFVDAGPAATNPPNGDVLAVVDRSGKGKLQNWSGGPAENSGEAVLQYPQTTGRVVTVDYQNVERFVKG